MRTTILRSIHVSSLLAVAFALASGCGNGGGGSSSPTSECENLCAEANKCPGATQTTDCAATCMQSQTEAAAANCSSQYDDFLSCAAGVTDACSTTTNPCANQETAFLACLVNYCAQTPTPASCTTTGTGGSGG